MAFQHVRSLIAGAVEVAPPKDVTEYTLATAVTAEPGQAFYFDDGELKLAAAGRMIAAVIALNEATAAGKVRGGWITPGQIYRCPITNKAGTAVRPTADIHATLTVGVGVTINDTGDGVDGETEIANAVGKPLTIVQIDKPNSVAYVVFSSCALAYDTTQGAT